MDYWAGGLPGSRKCECGIQGSCIDPTKWCNCDSNTIGELGVVCDIICDSVELMHNFFLRAAQIGKKIAVTFVKRNIYQSKRFDSVIPVHR